ncbi:hypothetical protein PSAC2689_30451 [Paraburkholderia sacchari]
MQARRAWLAARAPGACQVAYSGRIQYTNALNPCVTGDRVPERQRL